MAGWVRWEMPIRSRLSPYSRILQLESAKVPSGLVATSWAPLPHWRLFACMSPSTCPNSCVRTLLVNVAGSGMMTRPLRP